MGDKEAGDRRKNTGTGAPWERGARAPRAWAVHTPRRDQIRGLPGKPSAPHRPRSWTGGPPGALSRPPCVRPSRSPARCRTGGRTGTLPGWTRRSADKTWGPSVAMPRSVAPGLAGRPSRTGPPRRRGRCSARSRCPSRCWRWPNSRGHPRRQTWSWRNHPAGRCAQSRPCRPCGRRPAWVPKSRSCPCQSGCSAPEGTAAARQGRRG
mmetsp:Transcript_96215/g.258299  ORF Transcript_96215/g.258299 Transcript_96215/m.258299 type:complete len:208 (-) Transcript_96215:582-1205(-)